MQNTRRLPDMLRFHPTEQYKFAIILLGLTCLTFALSVTATSALNLGFVAILLFACFVAPRLTLSLPRSNFFVSFSDSVIFFTYLLYGPELAVVVTFAETVANCIYLKRKGVLNGKWMVLFNASLTATSTAIAV